MPPFFSWVRGSVLGLLVLASGCGGSRSVMTSDSGAPDAAAAEAGSPDTGAGGGAPDAAGDAEGAGASCVSVTGGGPEPWLELLIVGREFDAYDGRRIRVVVANDAGGRRGVADAAVVAGAFELVIPGTFNYGAYTEIALYIDDDADETCDVGEPLWGFVTGIVQAALVVEATPAEACLSGGGPSMFNGCRAWPPPAGPCAINLQADLTQPLACPP
jgi:hypothetical protein